LTFERSEKTPFKISVGQNSEKLVEIESTGDFFFWGRSPGKMTINLEDEFNKFGLDQARFISIEQSTSWKSFLYTVVTLGIYCPVDYKISLLTDKGPRN